MGANQSSGTMIGGAAMSQYGKNDFVVWTAPGTDLPNQPMYGTASDCMKACDNNASCVGFSRAKAASDTVGDSCWLKQNLANKVPGQPYQTFVKLSAQQVQVADGVHNLVDIPKNSSVTTVTKNITSPSSKKYWGPQTGIDYPGNDLGNTPNSDPDACATNCDNNPQCVGYVLGTDGPNCWLKSSFQNPRPSSVRTASVKPGQPAPPGLPQPPPVGYTAGATATYGDSAPWKYQGCFNDGNKGQPGPRVLKNNIGQVNSVSDCQKLAMQKGYNVFGLQFNGQCWADTNVAYDSQGTQQKCAPLGPAWGNQVYTSPKFDGKAAQSALAAILAASPPASMPPVAAAPVAAAPVAAAPVAAILAASPPASASQVAGCLQTLQSCIAATPDASAPATGTSSYTLEGASFVPVPTSKKILNLFLAFLVVFFAMLMMMKNK